MKNSRQMDIPLASFSSGATVLDTVMSTGTGLVVRTGALACAEKQIGHGVPELRESEWPG